MTANSQVKLPAYLQEIDGWLYDNPKRSKLADNKLLCNVVSLGNHGRLIESLKKEIYPKAKVLQFGGTFGGQIDAVADIIGEAGQYDIIDVCGTQIQRMEDKYRNKYPCLSFIHQNAAVPLQTTDTLNDKYDIVICYMLLHELPILTKIKIVNNALSAIKDNGKAVFIDYHNPGVENPLRYFIRMWNRLYQPFAEKLWDREINSFATKQDDIIWRKATYFARQYQKVIATKK